MSTGAEGPREYHCVLPSNELTSDLLYVASCVPEPAAAAFVTFLAHEGKRWVSLRNRRVMNIGGTVRSGGTIAEHIPPEALSLVPFMVKNLGPCWDPNLVKTPAGVCPTPNHVLINEYTCDAAAGILGGIMPHEDGPLYCPVVAIFSLESAVPLKFTLKSGLLASDSQPQDLWIVAEPNSLLVFRGKFYSNYLHSVPTTSVDEVPVELCANRNLMKKSTYFRPSKTPKVQKKSHVDSDEDIYDEPAPQLHEVAASVGTIDESILVIERCPRRTSVTYRYVPGMLRSSSLLSRS